MELVYTNDHNGGWVDQGVLKSFEMDLAYGADENEFEIAVPLDVYIPTHSLVYVDGSEWGGIVLGHKSSTFDDPVSYITGKTWHGILDETYILPPSGSTHYSVSGELNAALRRIIEHVGLDYLFQASPEDSGVIVEHTFDRFTDVYSGLRKMLASHGMKLKVEVLPNSKPCLYASPAGEYIDERDSGGIDYEIESSITYNHMLCIGEGEGTDRVIVNLYADKFGNVSDTPTFFGVERRTYRYEFTQTDVDEITKAGTKKLKELYEESSTCDLYLPDGRSYDVGDMVGVVDEINGITVTAQVTKVIVTVKQTGVVSVSNEVGNITARKS